MTRETGIHNASIALGTSGLKELSAVYYNFGAAELYEETLRRGEAQLTAQGALVARTGQHTGRSPKDKLSCAMHRRKLMSGGTTMPR
jgi:phosphoenolpyruvate carboxykinase (ATP)